MKHSISDNIRFIRESKSYSQLFMAQKLRVTQQAYSAMEKNPENMTLKRLKELCEILDVNLVTLLGEEDLYIQHNYHQKGGQAATQMVFNNKSDTEKELYERMINQLKEEIEYLRKKN